MTGASSYINSLGKSASSAEVARFIELLGTEPSKATQQSALDHLLQAVSVTPDQALALARCEVVKGSVGLQLSLKRYARAQEFATASTSHANRPGWHDVMEFLAFFP
jgi:hypothetical protein